MTGKVDVVWAHPHRSASLTAMLTDAELARLGSLRARPMGTAIVAGHALLRLVLADCWSLDPAAVALTFTCARCGGPHGRPLAVPPEGAAPVHLSLAHAGDRVLVAASQLGPVGIDVELERARPSRASTRSRWPRKSVRGSHRSRPTDATAARTRSWVRKESVLKATGNGLACDPRAVVVSPPSERPRRAGLARASRPSTVQLTDLDVGDGYAACLALLADHPAHVTLRRGDDWLRGDR